MLSYKYLFPKGLSFKWLTSDYIQHSNSKSIDAIEFPVQIPTC